MSNVTRLASPYKGLAPFEDSELDALLFFGRERESEVIAANLMASRLTVLFGPSGVGKSSVLRAGVAQRLRREAGVEVRLHSSWTGDPLEALAEVDAVTGRDLYLILDQFEEYFLYHEGDRTFPEKLGEIVRDAALRVNVLIGIREDALAQLETFKGVVPNLLANRLRLERLDRATGEAAIVGPVRRYNELVDGEPVDLERELIAAVLDQVAAGRVELGAAGRGVVEGVADADRIEAPYLQLVMTRLWEVETERGSRRLRLETLRELGGATKIVEDHLEHAMAELSPREKDTAAAMYNFLVTPSGTKIAHGVRDLAGYADVDEDEAANVLRRLSAERIVRASSEDGAATRYEIYHDVLADAVVVWRNRYAAERALREAERRRRRAFAIAAGALIALVVVAAIAVFALVERSRARTQTRHAHAGELVAEAHTALEVDPRQSIALALQAARRERSTQVEDALREALIASRVRAVVTAPHPVVARGPGFFVTGDKYGLALKLHGDGLISAQRNLAAPITAVAVAPDGSAVAGRRSGSLAELFPTGVVNFGYPVKGSLSALALGRDWIAAGSTSGTVSLWRGNSYPPRVLRVRGRVTSLAFTADDRLLLVTSRDRRARIVAVRKGRVVHTLTQRGFVNAAAFSPDGRVVVTGSQDWTARIWDVRTGRVLHELAPATGGITAIAFSPDGKLVALASSDAVSRVYDVRSGAVRFYLSGDTNAITDLDFNPSGTALVTGSADRTARIWTTDIGRLLQVLRGHTDTITRAFFTSDGTRVVTAGADGTVRVWDPGSEPELRVLARQKRRFAGATREPNGTITVIDVAGVARLLDPSARHVLRTFHVAAPKATRAEAVHGDLVARAGADEVVTVMQRGRTLHRFSADAAALEFSPDGRLLAAGGHDHYLRVWDVRSGRLLYAVVAHQGPVLDVSFNPDGRWIVTAGPISAGVWRADTGRQLLLLRGPTQPLHAALFTRDGRAIVTAGYDGTIRRYDCIVCGTFPQLVDAAEQQLAQTRPH